MANEILFPPGRLIMGDLYTGSNKDGKGQVRTVKPGKPNAGQPQAPTFFQGVAIPKAGETHWSQTAWGQQVLAIGAADHPNMYQNPAFAWKIDDGDSTVPNRSNKRPCDSVGAPGHWLVKFSSMIAPKVFTKSAAGAYSDVTANTDAVKRGWWVQASAYVKGNTGDTPGVYMNASAFLFVKQDVEISGGGVDAETAFAGAAVSQALPGVAAMPFAAAQSPAVLPGLPAQPVAPVMVQPNHAFLAVPAGLPSTPMAPPLPVAPVAPPVPAGPALTTAGVVSGFTYAQYRSSGWTDDQLRANGLIA